MAGRPKAIQIDDKPARAWEVPEALWQKLPPLKHSRLEATVRAQVLPLIQQIDALIPGKRGKKIPRLAKRSYKSIMTEPRAVEYALHLFDIAHAAGLITFVQAKGNTKPKPIRNPKQPVGPCGMSVKEAREFYMLKAAEVIAKNRGHKISKLHQVIGEFDLSDASSLHKLDMLLGFDPLSITELQKGLNGRLGPLLRKDDSYLVVMQNSRPVHFLRPLRRALDKDFRKILDWDGRFILAVSQGLDHSAKIVALGKTLGEIENPEIIRALGEWPLREETTTSKARGNKKAKKGTKYVSRIEEIKKLLGVQFQDILDAGPDMIREVGSWTDEEVNSIQNYLRYFTVDVIKALQGFPIAHKVGLLDGLWEKLGREFMEKDLGSPPSVKGIADLVQELIDSMGLERTPPDKVKNLILEGFFDHHLLPMIKMKEARAKQKQAEEKERRDKEAGM